MRWILITLVLSGCGTLKDVFHELPRPTSTCNVYVNGERVEDKCPPPPPCPAP